MVETRTRYPPGLGFVVHGVLLLFIHGREPKCQRASLFISTPSVLEFGIWNLDLEAFGHMMIVLGIGLSAYYASQGRRTS